VTLAQGSTRPSREQLLASAGHTVPDVVAPGLSVLFVGIDPGLYSGFTGHHFARPGNRFWRAIHQAGFTPRLLRPDEEALLPGFGIGVTNLVPRATASASELSDEELRRGARRVADLVRRLKPGAVAFLGVEAYRKGYGRPRAVVGRQLEGIDGRRVWVLPNPSGLNAHYQLDALVEAYAALRRELVREGAG
jgi:double-stranded uracil-DNA glycosylase